MSDTAVTASLLGDRTRVRILDALTAGPLRTAELAEVTAMTPAALSRHLKLLRTAGLIARSDVADDGRGRVYRLQPSSLDGLAGWLRSTSWAAEMAGTSSHPHARELLGRMGEFLDAFAEADLSFFERHLRDDAALVFPDQPEPLGKRACIDSVASHPPYRRHHILAEPDVRLVGSATSVITVIAEVATAVDDSAPPTFISAVFEEGHPWQLVHLQWTPAARMGRQEGKSDG